MIFCNNTGTWKVIWKNGIAFARCLKISSSLFSAFLNTILVAISLQTKQTTRPILKKSHKKRLPTDSLHQNGKGSFLQLWLLFFGIGKEQSSKKKQNYWKFVQLLNRLENKLEKWHNWITETFFDMTTSFELFPATKSRQNKSCDTILSPLFSLYHSIVSTVSVFYLVH